MSLEVKRQRRETLDAACDILSEFGLDELSDEIGSYMNGLMVDSGFLDDEEVP